AHLDRMAIGWHSGRLFGRFDRRRRGRPAYVVPLPPSAAAAHLADAGGIGLYGAECARSALYHLAWRNRLVVLPHRWRLRSAVWLEGQPIAFGRPLPSWLSADCDDALFADPTLVIVYSKRQG